MSLVNGDLSLPFHVLEHILTFCNSKDAWFVGQVCAWWRRILCANVKQICVNNKAYREAPIYAHEFVCHQLHQFILQWCMNEGFWEPACNTMDRYDVRKDSLEQAKWLLAKTPYRRAKKLLRKYPVFVWTERYWKLDFSENYKYRKQVTPKILRNLRNFDPD